MELWKKNGWVPPAVNLDEVQDFVGYGQSIPNIAWPEGKKLAVSFVVNFGEGEDVHNNTPTNNLHTSQEIITEENTKDHIKDSNLEYGTRVGYWRLMETFERYNVKITLSASGKAVEKSPWLAKDASSRGHEVATHGHRNRTHSKMSEEEESQIISKSVSVIKDATGKAPVGWHTRSERSPFTRNLLVENGFLYSDDAYNDETPYFVKVNQTLHLILPYSLDTNDIQFQNTNNQRFNTAPSFAKYVCDSFDWLLQRESHLPRVMTIGLNLRMISRPGRMPELESILQHVSDSGKAWIATREDIARYWMKSTNFDAISSVNSNIESTPSKSDIPLGCCTFHTYSSLISGSDPDISNDKIIDTKPFNLLVINPNTSVEATNYIRRRVERILPPTVQIEALTAIAGESYISSEIAYARSCIATLDTFIEYSKKENAMKPDAILVSCFGDCGVWPLREHLNEKGLKIPVMGLAEAAMRQASERPGRFAVVTGGKAWAPILTRLSKAWNLYGYVSGIHTVSLNGAQLHADRAAAIQLLRESCIQAVVCANGKAEKSNERCTSVILGGALLSGLTDEVLQGSTLSVPLIDSLNAGVEMIVRALNSDLIRGFVC